MTYDPTITAARRAAKQIARETGAPYQSSLDAVAQRAGRSDWDAYLASPAALPDGEDLYVNGEEHRHNQKAVFLTGVGTLPALSTLPLIVTQGHDTTPWGLLQIMGLALGFWMCATLGALMFFDMLAVHPDAPEVGGERHPLAQHVDGPSEIRSRDVHGHAHRGLAHPQCGTGELSARRHGGRHCDRRRRHLADDEDASRPADRGARCDERHYRRRFRDDGDDAALIIRSDGVPTSTIRPRTLKMTAAS